ncbi:MAG: protein-methionine-sulfoxide reductase catalytic subunit MsrP, partial [Sulfurimonadaceae bacterium]|nr:protein-methionine-sulfoxide reductase catalytic subunit MsrP [Sulfurimonadaceae bacterium]
MYYLKKRPWELPEASVTDERLFNERRKFLKLGAAMAVSTSAVMDLAAKEFVPDANLDYRSDPNLQKLALTGYDEITSYNNFYEFTTSKSRVKPLAKNFKSDPWSIIIDGLVEKPMTVDLQALLKQFELEERIYRFRCVEGWSMVVPWVGIPLGDILKRFEPNSNARYVRFKTLHDPERMPGQRRRVLDWPDVEGLTIEEAMHPLTLMTVGLYGRELPNQNGAPLRLVVPWKYGFK